MKPQRNPLLYLNDMIVSMERIISYLDGHDFQSFCKNFMVVDAVVRNFEIIGEASKKVSDETKNLNSGIPWKKMYQLRNIVSHEYFDVDHETIWQIATMQLPQNLIDIKRIREIITDRDNFK